MKTRIRALVLAAGSGQRLRPLTGFLPKPLLPVAGSTVAGHTLQRLEAVGCHAAALNLHHLGDQVERHFGPRHGQLELVYSREPELLGTLGALRPLRSFLGAAEVILVINGDSLCRWPLKKLVRRHLSSGALATLLLSRHAPTEVFSGGVGTDSTGRIQSLRRTASGGHRGPRRYVFAGAHALSPRLLDRLEDLPTPSDIVADLYTPLLREGSLLQSVLSDLPWYDLGTPGRYLEGAYEWARGRWPRRLWRRRWIAKSARVESGAKVIHSMIESGSRIARESVVAGSLILTGATVGRGSQIRGCIVAPGVDLPQGAWLERRLITPLKAGRDPGANDSVVGQLVYTPIDSPA